MDPMIFAIATAQMTEYAREQERERELRLRTQRRAGAGRPSSAPRRWWTQLRRARTAAAQAHGPAGACCTAAACCTKVACCTPVACCTAVGSA